MKNPCENCGKCCVETEMILSENDIDLIKNKCSNIINNYDFVLKNENDQFQLKNKGGYCVFFDNSSKNCTIYLFRPQGCRFYPLIYDINEKRCKLDEDCPRTNLFYQNNQDFKTTCQNLRVFLKKQLNLEINKIY
ncbi:MAG: YkgJ family cysteine cluster protein [Promethearchaeota archaeon]